MKVNEKMITLDGYKNEIVAIGDKMRCLCSHYGCDGEVLIPRSAYGGLIFESARCIKCGQMYRLKNPPARWK